MFGASGQEELAKRLAELEISREFLSTLDDQDWFDEDFGLSSSHKIQKNKAEETIVPLMAEPKRVPQKPCETLSVVPHTAEEVESLVHNAAEELWKWKELGQDLHGFSIPAKFLGCASKGLDIGSTSRRVYKQVTKAPPVPYPVSEMWVPGQFLTVVLFLFSCFSLSFLFSLLRRFLI